MPERTIEPRDSLSLARAQINSLCCLFVVEQARLFVDQKRTARLFDTRRFRIDESLDRWQLPAMAKTSRYLTVTM